MLFSEVRPVVAPFTPYRNFACANACYELTRLSLAVTALDAAWFGWVLCRFLGVDVDEFVYILQIANGDNLPVYQGSYQSEERVFHELPLLRLQIGAGAVGHRSLWMSTYCLKSAKNAMRKQYLREYFRNAVT